MDEFIYHVGKGWYRLYSGLMLAFSLTLLGMWGLAHLVPSMAGLSDSLALSGSLLTVAGLHMLYVATIYWPSAKRSLPFATLGGSMIFSLMLLNGLAITDPAHAAATLFVAAWIATIMLDGMFGLPFLLGWLLLTLVYTLLKSNFQLTEVSSVSWILLGGSAVAAVGSYFFWKRQYINAQAEQVSQLSGMLRSNRQQSEILIESIADGVIVVNTDGKITLMNSAAAKMTEWPVNEASGVEVAMVVKLSHEKTTDAPLEENPFGTVLSKKQRFEQILQLTGRDDKKLIISLVVSPVVLPGANSPVGAVAVMRDVSEQRAVEQQRADFISTAAHEMRTPVAAIEGYLALALNEKVSTIDTRARSYLEKAHSSTQHLGKLFQDLLTSSKAEDGRLSNHPAVVEMGAFMQQLTDDLKFTAEKKGLFAEFIVGSADNTIDATAKDAAAQHMVKPLYYVLVDPDRMREVITNLFDNAVKYTEQGKISIGLTGDNDVVQLYVRDTGPGIPAEDLPHLFQKFYRVDSSATRTIGGTGLGLFICRKIVELYKGRIWVESEPDKGSTFFINLPRLSTQRASELQATEAPQAPVASGAPLQRSMIQ